MEGENTGEVVVAPQAAQCVCRMDLGQGGRRWLPTRGVTTATIASTQSSSPTAETTSRAKGTAFTICRTVALQTFLSLECLNVTWTAGFEVADVQTKTFHVLLYLVAYIRIAKSTMDGTPGAVKNGILVGPRGYVRSPNILVVAVVSNERRCVYGRGKEGILPSSAMLERLVKKFCFGQRIGS